MIVISGFQRLAIYEIRYYAHFSVYDPNVYASF